MELYEIKFLTVRELEIINAHLAKDIESKLKEIEELKKLLERAREEYSEMLSNNGEVIKARNIGDPPYCHKNPPHSNPTFNEERQCEECELEEQIEMDKEYD